MWTTVKIVRAYEVFRPHYLDFLCKDAPELMGRAPTEIEAPAANTIELTLTKKISKVNSQLLETDSVKISKSLSKENCEVESY